MAGGLNLYGYGNGDPINNSDPFGLCVSDSVKTTVTIDCGGGKTSTRRIWAKQATDAEMAGVATAAGRLTGGNAEFSPGDIAHAYQTLAATGSIFVLPKTVDGKLVLEGGVTNTGGGTRAYTAFRRDALNAIAKGNLGATIGNLGMNAATVLGHEGAHLFGSRHPATYAIQWGYQP